MSSPVRHRLNETGDGGATYVVHRGAAHASLAQRTTEHAHYAWKIHVGIDAPVWVRSSGSGRGGAADAGASRVLVVPPGLTHATGGVGWSVALFVEPGSRATPWRGAGEAFAVEGEAARRLVRLGEEVMRAGAGSVGEALDDVVRTTFGPLPRALPVDARARAALEAMRREPRTPLPALAAHLRISMDRLTHLVSTQTGMPPRRHVIWQRLLRVLDAGAQPASLAVAAHEAGFADHAHMTRTFRRFLGRAPSEFRAPPVVVAPWTGSGSGIG
jgi:AraC-like DNA-binding protein